MVAFASSSHPFFFRGDSRLETRLQFVLFEGFMHHAMSVKWERRKRRKEAEKKAILVPSVAGMHMKWEQRSSIAWQLSSCFFCRYHHHASCFGVSFLPSCLLLASTSPTLWFHHKREEIRQTNQSYCVVVVAKRGSTNTRIQRHMERHSKNVLRQKPSVSSSSAQHHTFFLHFFRFCCLHSHVTDRPHWHLSIFLAHNEPLCSSDSLCRSWLDLLLPLVSWSTHLNLNAGVDLTGNRLLVGGLCLENVNTFVFRCQA